MEKKVDGFFADLEKKIDAFGAVGPKKITANQNDKKKDDNSNNGTSCSWAQERLKNGGATSNTRFEKGESLCYARVDSLLTLRKSIKTPRQ
jgi:hypothetical protein